MYFSKCVLFKVEVIKGNKSKFVQESSLLVIRHFDIGDTVRPTLAPKVALNRTTF